jgi:hypothetical protein
MRLATAITLHAYGTSSGVERAWDTRGRGRAVRPTIPNLNRSKVAKANYVPVTAAKIKAAGESVNILAKAIGGTVTGDHHPWDVLLKGTKIGIEVKRFEPGRKNLKATIHSGADVKGAKSQGSKERKVEFADKNGMKHMYLVVHDNSTPGKEGWYIRRVGDKGDPRSDPKDPRSGWSYNTYAMKQASLSQLKGLLK